MKLVLVVEDDSDIQTSIMDVLKSAGFETRGASNGQEALEYLAAANTLPALILLDLMMPVMDGWQFRAQQSVEPKLKDIPVIVISAGGNVEQKARNIGATGWLKKPLQVDNLLSAVRQNISA